MIVVVLLQIWVSVVVNTDDSNSALNWTNMNVWLRWGQMKLHRQYVNSLHLIMISHLSNRFSCDDRCTLAKVWSLVCHWCQCLVWWAYFEPCMNKPRICHVSLIDLERCTLEMILGNFKECEPIWHIPLLWPTLWVCEPFWTPLEPYLSLEETWWKLDLS